MPVVLLVTKDEEANDPVTKEEYRAMIQDLLIQVAKRDEYIEMQAEKLEKAQNLNESQGKCL